MNKCYLIVGGLKAVRLEVSLDFDLATIGIDGEETGSWVFTYYLILQLVLQAKRKLKILQPVL